MVAVSSDTGPFQSPWVPRSPRRLTNRCARINITGGHQTVGTPKRLTFSSSGGLKIRVTGFHLPPFPTYSASVRAADGYEALAHLEGRLLQATHVRVPFSAKHLNSPENNRTNMCPHVGRPRRQDDV
jgi:hypothetical protein